MGKGKELTVMLLGHIILILDRIVKITQYFNILS